MPDNLVCKKCGQQFNNQQDFQKHILQCTGKGAKQSGSDRPMTHGAGGHNPNQ